MSKMKSNHEKSFYERFAKFMEGTLEPEDIHEPKISKLEHLEKEELKLQIAEAIIAGEEERVHKDYKKWRNSLSVKFVNGAYKSVAILVCLVVIGILLFTVSYLPTFGNKSNPDNNEVSERYIEQGLQETGAVNIVSGMILDYRAFDTYGESNVLFIACCSVLILLRNDDRKKHPHPDEDVADFKEDPIVQAGARILLPIIMIFGIYIILNGHLSPGGGFSGGAIIGAGLIMYANAFGFEKMEKMFNYKTFKVITTVSLLFYGLAKSYSFYTGANHIESIIPLGIPGAILSSGLILPLNICVGLVVACTMYGFYALFKRGGM